MLAQHHEFLEGWERDVVHDYVVSVEGGSVVERAVVAIEHVRGRVLHLFDDVFLVFVPSCQSRLQTYCFLLNHYSIALPFAVFDCQKLLFFEPRNIHITVLDLCHEDRRKPAVHHRLEANGFRPIDVDMAEHQGLLGLGSVIPPHRHN